MNQNYKTPLVVLGLLVSILFVINGIVMVLILVDKNPTSYDECISANGFVLKKLHEDSCVTDNGSVFIKPMSDLERKLLSSIQTSTPIPTQPKPLAKDGCFVVGCSNELCVDESKKDLTTTCIYKPMYACYRHAICERQSNGSCGWTETPIVTDCIEQYEESGTTD